jgi:hypothetical protein
MRQHLHASGDQVCLNAVMFDEASSLVCVNAVMCNQGFAHVYAVDALIP